MKRRQANKIIKKVGFHSFYWRTGKLGQAFKEYPWKMSTIEKAFDYHTVPRRSVYCRKGTRILKVTKDRLKEHNQKEIERNKKLGRLPVQDVRSYGCQS